jgi:hypothetical protein
VTAIRAPSVTADVARRTAALDPLVPRGRDASVS